MRGCEMTKEAMQQALEALSAELWMMLDKPVDEQYRVRYAYLLRVITALREALAQPEQAQRPWVGLTEEEIAVIGDKVANEDLVGLVSNFRVRLARAIEQALKAKNHG